MTLSEKEWLSSALEAIEQVKTEADLLDWDDKTASDPHYIKAETQTVRRIEDAYARKLREITGWGAE